MRSFGTVLAVALSLWLSACATGRDVDWRAYGGPLGDRYSKLAQINRRSISGLKEVWRFETGRGGLQTSPLVVGRVLYGYTPTQNVFALDGASGKLLWTFDPGSPFLQPARGFAYWTDGKAKRLFASHAAELLALDPDHGTLVSSFGDKGRVDLRQGLGRDPKLQAAYLTTPGVIYRDLIILGFRTAETKPAAPGAIRAYDVRTGKLRWTFNLVPRPGEPGAETWPKGAWKTAGGANNWAGMAIDARRGIVFVPTGSAASDFYGADRRGDDLYANSLVALEAATGRRLWHFQAVHHDIWDMDFPAPPVLITVTHGGRRVDAVAQTTKHGFVFVFDRATGKPLFPIEERPVPQSDVPGESASLTQPFALKPAPYVRQGLTEDMLTRRTPQAHAAVAAEFKTLRNKGLFTPLAVGAKTVVFPGFDGGAEWGGPGVDRPRGVLYVNAHEWVSVSSLAPVGVKVSASRGEALYARQCAACHGGHLEGSPPQFPPLIGLPSRMNAEQTMAMVRDGGGRMPGFPQIAGDELKALVAFVRGEQEPGVAEAREAQPPGGADDRLPYTFTGYGKFTDPDGYPAIEPPWGTLNAIDLNTGEFLWRVPLGQHPILAAQGLKDTGSENYGGPVVTAGGVVIIGATVWDRKIRGFDSRTGRKLWEADLPYAGVATPITYSIAGRQYVVIATSGARDPKGPQGSAYVAFALPLAIR